MYSSDTKADLTRKDSFNFQRQSNNPHQKIKRVWIILISG